MCYFLFEIANNSKIDLGLCKVYKNEFSCIKVVNILCIPEINYF